LDYLCANNRVADHLRTRRLTEMLRGIADYDRLTLLEYVCDDLNAQIYQTYFGYIYEVCESIINQCITSGSPNCLTFMLENGYFLHQEDDDPDDNMLLRMFKQCVIYGRYEIMEYIYNFFLDYFDAHPDKIEYLRRGLSHENMLPQTSNFDTLWVHHWPKEDFRMGNVLNTFEYMINTMVVPFTERTLVAALTYGDPDIVTYIHQKLNPISDWAYMIWVSLFLLEPLEKKMSMLDHIYSLYKRIPRPGLIMTSVVSTILQKVATTLIPRLNSSCLELQHIYEQRCGCAINWLLDRGIKWTNELTIAVSYGSVSTVAMMLERKAPFDLSSVIYHAVKILEPIRRLYSSTRTRRFYDMVTYLRNLKADWWPDSVRMIVQYSSLYYPFEATTDAEFADILKWMVANGAPYDKDEIDALLPGISRIISLRKRKGPAES
jgi:hypothetical protein